MWVGSIEVRDLRNICHADVELAPGLNVFVGKNAQGKTSFLEAVALLARGRSFRTDDTPSLIRRGAPGLRSSGLAREGTQHERHLEVEVGTEGRRLRVDGQDVSGPSYHGQLEAVVYATERLKVVVGPMRERRLFLDRAGSALWPAYRRTATDYERVLRQRNAALERGARDLEAWTDQLIEAGANLRLRRSRYVERLRACLRRGLRLGNEEYDIHLTPEPAATDPDERARLREQIARSQIAERRACRTLVGPHRDVVRLDIGGEDATAGASSGQARSLLLALAVACLDVYKEERGTAPVALLDDLDSELDLERATQVCREVAAKGQALLTTAHPAWATALREHGKLFEVDQGTVRAA